MERNKGKGNGGPGKKAADESEPKGKAAARAKPRTMQNVPKHVAELVTAAVAEAQPQLEHAHRLAAPPGTAAAMALPAFGGPLRAIALEVLRMAAAAAGQSLAAYVEEHKDVLLARLPASLVTAISALLTRIRPANMAPTPPAAGDGPAAGGAGGDSASPPAESESADEDDAPPLGEHEA